MQISCSLFEEEKKTKWKKQLNGIAMGKKRILIYELSVHFNLAYEHTDCEMQRNLKRKSEKEKDR